MGIRSKSVEVLGRLGDERAETLLLEFAQSSIEPLRLSALNALERIRIAAAVPVLLKHVRQANITEKILAARALAKSGAMGIEHLRSLLMEDEPMVRSVAEQVLEEVEPREVVA
jgi:HEAT repeat protein